MANIYTSINEFKRNLIQEISTSNLYKYLNLEKGDIVEIQGEGESLDGDPNNIDHYSEQLTLTQPPSVQYNSFVFYFEYESGNMGESHIPVSLLDTDVRIIDKNSPGGIR